MKLREKILLESKAWAKEKLLLDRNYFKRLAGMHTPKILWIGCSDSLIAVRELTNTEPGEIVVYRNIANQVREDDFDLMALLQDCLTVSKIDLIIVCGYSHSSGIRDILLGVDDRPMVRQWLSEVEKLFQQHKDKFEGLDFEVKERVLSELNVRQQIINLSKLDMIKKSWEQRNSPTLLGLWFDLANGKLTEQFAIEPGEIRTLNP